MSTTCECLSDDQLVALNSGSVPLEELILWKRHLRLCDSCSVRLTYLRTYGRTKEGGLENSDNMLASVRSYGLIGLEPDVEIGDFVIEKRLGSGAMGVVYQAMQVSLKRRVALKVLPMALASDEKVIERFRREAHAAAMLHHPHIVPIYAEGVEEGICYYAMELIHGQRLDHALSDLTGLPALENNASRDVSDSRQKQGSHFGSGSGKDRFRRIAQLISDAADALDYAHQQGVIHRDIKPSNIMLARDGRLFIVDFGLVHLIQEQPMTLTGSCIGTPLYMSPEQVSTTTHEIDHRTDVYSLGATLYELLAGKPLFAGQTHQQIINQIVNLEPRRLRQLDHRIPMDLETICLKALAKDPDMRYQTAGEFAADLRRFLEGRVIRAKRKGVVNQSLKLVNRHRLSSALVLCLLIGAGIAGLYAWHYHKAQWVQQKAIPEILRLVEEQDYYSAYLLAKEAERLMPSHPLLVDLRPQLSQKMTVTSSPSGAEIYLVENGFGATRMVHLGQTPLNSIRVPFGIYCWRIKKKGMQSLESIQSIDLSHNNNIDELPVKSIHFTLHQEGLYPEDMVWIPPSTLNLGNSFSTTAPILSAPPFLVDKFEVTNRQFKVFLDHGGYEDPRYWQSSFFKDDKRLTFAEAMREFKDLTGHTGPAGWMNGTFPLGQAHYPVGGLSWYEAQAYAHFVGKELPTVYHWTLAAHTHDIGWKLASLSNFGDVCAPVGSHPGRGKYGLFDMVGNVREWCYNEMLDEIQLKCLLGGAWTDPKRVSGRVLISPWNRDSVNGFRCVKYLGGKHLVPPEAFSPVKCRIPKRNVTHIIPPTDKAFCAEIETLYKYDRTPLNETVESIDNDLGYCRRERISYDAAYLGERITAYLHIPYEAKPPYQIVTWFPGDSMKVEPWDGRSAYMTEVVNIIQSGRAVIIPFYKGTWDRRTPELFPLPSGSIQERNYVIQLSQDLCRTVDYLQTREDIDIDKLAYVGYCWGAERSPMMLANEPRFKTGILLSAGFYLWVESALAVADPPQFVSRVSIPILMINGRDDTSFPYETAQRPFYNLLGTPPAHKKHVLFPGGHTAPRRYPDQYYREILDWLDLYLGPVTMETRSM